LGGGAGSYRIGLGGKLGEKGVKKEKIHINVFDRKKTFREKESFLVLARRNVYQRKVQKDKE